MTPDEQLHNGPHDTQPGDVLDKEPEVQFPDLKPLLNDATATIHFDGLIYVAYNERKKLLQAAVLTEAEGHEVVVRVWDRATKTIIWPLQASDWERDHGTVKKMAPFWLYVDSGQGNPKGPFSAELYRLEDDTDPKSFANVFNFDDRYNRQIALKPRTFAEFNFPDGISYSAKNTSTDLKSKEQGAPVTSAVTQKRNFTVSRRIGIDINAASNGGGKKSIVLVGDGGKHQFFSFELSAARPYVIEFLNRPIKNDSAEDPHDHGLEDAQSHFLQFYELVRLEAGEAEFFVAPATTTTTDSPPCVGTTGGGKGGLGGGG